MACTRYSSPADNSWLNRVLSTGNESMLLDILITIYEKQQRDDSITVQFITF